jgi:hypothetical protein
MKKKKLIVLIEAQFDVPDDVDQLSCIGEAIEMLQQSGSAVIKDMDTVIVDETA